MPIKITNINIQKVVETAINQVKYLAVEKNIVIKTTINVENISADEHLLFRIIFNLLNNAVKVSPDYSLILIRVTKNINNVVEFRIDDQVPGIKKGMEDKIFGKFSQLEMRKSGQITGSGIALSFCRNAVEAQGVKYGPI